MPARVRSAADDHRRLIRAVHLPGATAVFDERRCGRTTGGPSSSGRCGSGTSRPTSSPAGSPAGRPSWPPADGSPATTAWPAAACLASSTAVGVSGALLVADLGRPARFLNMLRVAKVTSPMSVGTWLLSAFGTAVTAATASELTGVGPPDRPGRGGGRRRAGPGHGHLHRGPGGRHRRPRLARRPPPAPLRLRRRRRGQLRRPGRHPRPRRRRAPGGWPWAGRSSSWPRPRPSNAGLGDVGEAYHRGRARRLKQLSQRRHRRRRGRSSPPSAAAAGSRRWPGALLVLVGAAAERFAVFHAGIESAVDPAFTVGPQRQRLASADGSDSAAGDRQLHVGRLADRAQGRDGGVAVGDEGGVGAGLVLGLRRRPR